MAPSNSLQVPQHVGARGRALTDTAILDNFAPSPEKKVNAVFQAPEKTQIPRRPHLVPYRDHPELAPAKGIQKCQPATCPHPHSFVGRGQRDIEVYSEVLERTVTPEAHTYFRRIVQVTQSELEKLLVYKIQQLFDPVASSAVAGFAVKELGASAASRLQLPGVSAAAHIAELEGAKATSFRRQSTPHEKAVEEGRQLTKFLVGNLGRILADFGRFSDTILRWENAKANEEDLCEKDAFPLTELTNRAVQQDDGNSGNFKDIILERLERQNQENSVVESKYVTVSNELRENRRAFMRERALWREQLGRLKRALKRSKDPTLVKLLEHDVEFFDGGDRPAEEEEDVDEVRQRYEELIAQMREKYEDEMAELKTMNEMLRAKIQALQEKPVRKESAMSYEDLEAQRNMLEQQKKELEDLIAQLHSEAKELFRQLNDMTEERAEAEEANIKLTGQLALALSSLQEAQEALALSQAAVAKTPQRAPHGVGSQASPKDWGSWRRESPSCLKIDVAPVEADGEELDELRRQLKELGEQLVEQMELAERRLTEAEEARAALHSLQVEYTEKATQWERDERDRATQTAQLLEKVRKRPPTNDSSVQTAALPSAEEEALRKRIKELEEENAKLQDLLAQAQTTIAHIQHQVDEANRRIKALEEELARQQPSAPVITKRRESMSRKGGGWNWTHKKSRASIAAEKSQLQQLIEFQKSDSPRSSQSSSKSNSPPPNAAEERQYRQKDLKRGARGAVLNFRPSLDAECVNFIESAQADVNSTAQQAAQYGQRSIPNVASTAQQAVSNISLPVSRKGSPPRPRSAGFTTDDAAGMRTSYGGGFTVLDTTAWKGADRSDQPDDQLFKAQPTSDAAETALFPSFPSSSDADDQNAAEVWNGGGVSVSTQAGGTEATAVSRPPPVPGRPNTGAGGRPGKSQSVPDLARAGNIASRPSSAAERECVRLPRPQSASSLPVPARLSLLHGPPERRSRPNSALQVGSVGQSPQPSRPQSAVSRTSRPQSAASRPSRPQSAASQPSSRPQSAAKQRPGSAGGYYGSAIFDSR